MTQKIEVPGSITVGSLAEKLSLPVTRVIGELFKNGIMSTVNERIDFDTAQIIVGELELDLELVKQEEIAVSNVRAKRQSSDDAKSRPPVVAVMGHVDHGKTSLLDAIRGAEVVKGESGGITQHISAYQIKHAGRPITFLDTPGHAAFAALREHGAQLTDLAIIVVALDDGIKPQTLEAIRFAKKAGVKMIIAANKLDKSDKPEADLNKLKQQLSENDLMPEDWGGDIIVMPVSAKTKEGLPELLDMIFLVADVEELKADYEGLASGLIIEAHMETGRGAVAIALVEQGNLKPGQFVVAGGSYAKVRNLETTTGVPIDVAGPATPVIMTGFKTLPEFGDEFAAVNTEKEARHMSVSTGISRKSSSKLDMTSNELIRIINRNNLVQELNIIVKADVQGSLTSVIDSLKTMDTDEVAIRIVGSGVGAITENDIRMASATGAIIYGFHIEMPTNIKRLATRDKIGVRLYSIIYELLDDAKIELQSRLAPEVIETELGRLLVRGVFKITKNSIICGGEVTKGIIKLPSLAKLYRGDTKLAELTTVSLKNGPQEAKEVLEGTMCGVSFSTESKVEVLEGDRIEFFTRETRQRTL